METTATAEPDVRPWRERMSLHPIAGLEPDFNDEAEAIRWWRDLGFQQAGPILFGQWRPGNEEPNADGLWGTPPPVDEGWCRVAVWSDDDGHSYAFDVKPVTAYALSLVAFVEANGWPSALDGEAEVARP